MPCFPPNAYSVMCSHWIIILSLLNIHELPSTRANTDYAFIVFPMSCGAKNGARAILSYTFLVVFFFFFIKKQNKKEIQTF